MNVVSASSRPSYREHTYWQAYEPFLPPSLRAAAAPPDEEWREWKGGLIHLDRYRPAEGGGASATVLALHGAGGYGRLLAPFARMISQAGYQVVAPDLPGYGLSQVPSHLICHAAWVDLVCDMAAALQQETRRPVVLAGFSIGGYLAYLAAARTPAVSGVIATTLADPRLPLVQAQFARHPLLARVGLPLLPALDTILGRVRLPIRWFSNMGAIANDPALCKVFLADSYGAGRSVPVHFMRSLFAATPDIEPEQFDRCPVLLAHPAADRWTTVEASRLLYDRLNTSKQLVLLEHCGHFPVEEPGVTQLRDAVLAFLKNLVEPAAPLHPRASARPAVSI